MTLNRTVEELEQIIAKIKIQTIYKIIGFLLAPLIVGIFIIKQVNKNLYHLFSSKEKTVDNVKRDIKKALKEVGSTYEQIKKEETYLIYSVRENITDSFNQYLSGLSFLKSRKKLFHDEFNFFVNDSYNHIAAIKENVQNFNSGFIERRMKKYDYLFKKSPFPLDADQKTAIITDDKHNLVVAGAGSGKTEVLITRIAYLVERKQDTIKPERILALAFQNKASREIKERLNKRYGVDVKIKTFHALGKEILEKATENSKKGAQKLKFSGDNYEREYNRFIETLFKKAQEDSELQMQNDLINYMKLYGDDEVIEKEVDFETKEEYYRYMHNLTYTHRCSVKRYTSQHHAFI